MLALLAAAASRLLKQIDSDQGLVTVWETDTHKMMLMNSTVIGAEYIDSFARDQAAFSGMALMQAVWFMVSQTGARPASALCVGLGAGTVPSFLISKGVDVDVVEHSAAVLRAAESHFLYGATGHQRHAHVADALFFLFAEPPRFGRAGIDGKPAYDAVVLDLFDGEDPARLLTTQLFDRVKATWIRRGGAVVVNVVAFWTGEHVGLARAVVRTLRASFAHVRAFVDHDPSEQTDEPANIVSFASDRPFGFDAPPYAEDDQSVDWMWANFQRWEVLQAEDELRDVDGGDGGMLLSADTADVARARLGGAGAAVAAGMREKQKGMLSDEDWAHAQCLVAARRGERVWRTDQKWEL